MVEKPITLHSADALDLCNLASEKGLVLMVGHTFEYNPGVLALKRMIETHELGDIYYIDTARLNLGLFQPGLNVMWDLAPHDISILNFITGSRPISVNAMGTHCVFNSIYDVAYLTLHYQGGIIAHVHVSWLDPCKVRRVTVVGSKKMVVYNDIEVSEKIKIFDKGVETPTHDIANFDEFQCSYRSGDVLIPNIKMTEPLRAECQHFIDCVTNGTTPCSSGVDGLNVVKVLEAADLSLHNSGHMEEIEWETEKLPELAQM
jgi:predicted dehydrogenase